MAHHDDPLYRMLSSLEAHCEVLQRQISLHRKRLADLEACLQEAETILADLLMNLRRANDTMDLFEVYHARSPSDRPPDWWLEQVYIEAIK